MARSEMTEHLVLVLIQKSHKLNCLENSSCASETMYEAFNFSLKLHGVLSKQLA